VLISSERLSDDAAWHAISVGEIVIVESGLQLDVRPART
jgi:predicted glutamine amidotransferase